MAEAAIVVSGGAAEKAESAAAPPTSWPPSVADRYKNPVKLGQGFFGRVYAAWDTVNEQLVAVKQLSGRTDDEFVATGPCEFEQEVSSLLACHGHPNVVKFLAAFDDVADGDRFIVTELAGPMNLRQLVQLRRKEKKPFTEGEVRDAMAQLLSGVACAHGAGIMHRDVTPENVVVDQLMRKKKKKMAYYKYTICGFNASELTTKKKEERDGSAMLASSSHYRAPELFLGSMDYDDRIDTWALGCVMADLLAGTGSPFFGGGTDEEAFEKMLRVVGEQGIIDWPGFQKVAAPDTVAKLQKQVGGEHKACLREAFPKETLSPAGFDVLSGLLQSNPEHRLTAAAALQMPWFRRRRRRGFAACFAASS